MTSIATVSAAKDRIKCNAGGSAQHLFVVKNTSGHHLTVGARVLPDPPAQGGWFSLEGEAERALAPNETDQFAVSVRAPADAQPGTCTFHLLVYDTAAPGEDFSPGPTVAIEIEAPQKPVETPQPKKKFPWLILIVALVVLVAAATAITIWLTSVPSTNVPDLAGKTLPQADQLLNKAALRRGTTVDKATGQPVTSGTVVNQSPPAGAEAEEGSAVDVVVELEPARLPDLGGKPEAEAKKMLEQSGLTLGGITRQQTAASAPGTVIAQRPAAGSPFNPGDKVYLTVAEAVKTIDLTGTWSSNDRGRCYVRQSGQTVFWYCELAPTNPAWSNVFDGRLQEDVLAGAWADVPKGRTGGMGTLRLKVAPSGDVLTAIERTGGYGGSEWKRER